MPLREYHCKACGHDFEVLEQSTSATVVCEVCASKRVERLLSVFAAATGARSAEPAPPCGNRECANRSCAWNT